jgi:hypothetical protein
MDSFTEASRFSSAESRSANAPSETLSEPQAANLRDISVSETPIYADRVQRRDLLQTTQSVLERSSPRHSGVEPLPGTQTDQQRSGSRNPAAEPSAMPAQPAIGRDDSAAQIVPTKLVSTSRDTSSALNATNSTAVDSIAPKKSANEQMAVTRRVQAKPATLRSSENIGRDDSAAQIVSTKLSSTSRDASSALNATNSTAADSIAPKKSANEQTAVTRRVQAEPATLRSPENKSYPRQQLQPVSHINARAEKTSSDVTISIGHIEIRAAQVAERPRRPAFRPRVSLNDFLNQQNGQLNRELV